MSRQPSPFERRGGRLLLQCSESAAAQPPHAHPCVRTCVHRTSLGIKATNGVVLATEKKMSSPLMDPTSVQKICNLTDAAGIVYSGMGPDFRVLVNKGRKAAQQYFRVYQVGAGVMHRRCACTGWYSVSCSRVCCCVVRS